MQTTIIPYEVLIRFKRDGTISGAHIINAVRVMSDEGEEISYALLPPVPAGEAGADFPLSEAVSTTIADALAALPLPQND